MLTNTAKIIRDGKLIQIDAINIYPGDIVKLEEGDKIPADIRIIESKNLTAIESSLTGESYPVNKDSEILLPGTAMADRTNMLFMSTFIAAGSATGVVTNTGNSTIIGGIAKSISTAGPKKSNFLEQINKLTKQISLVAISIASLIFIVAFFIQGESLIDTFLFSIAALVSGVPEGLPAI